MKKIFNFIKSIFNKTENIQKEPEVTPVSEKKNLPNSVIKKLKTERNNSR